MQGLQTSNDSPSLSKNSSICPSLLALPDLAQLSRQPCPNWFLRPLQPHCLLEPCSSDAHGNVHLQAFAVSSADWPLSLCGHPGAPLPPFSLGSAQNFSRQAAQSLHIPYPHLISVHSPDTTHAVLYLFIVLLSLLRC